MRKYPASLPAPLKADRSYKMVDPMVSTSSDNGQTRWDRRFTSTPTATPVSWIFTDEECALFRTWFKNELRDGVEWFEMLLAADDGRRVRQCHFVQAYSGPDPVGYDRWRITASVVLRTLPTIDAGWLLLPEYWLPRGRAIFDIAMNRNWPLYAYEPSLTDEAGEDLLMESGEIIELERSNNG